MQVQLKDKKANLHAFDRRKTCNLSYIYLYGVVYNVRQICFVTFDGLQNLL